MKKNLIYLILIIFLVMLAAGCSSGPDGGIKSYSDPSETINTASNSEFIIALESNPTTGYTWEVEYDETHLELLSQEYKAEEHEEGMVGVGGTDHFRFKALQGGNSEIVFVYAQHWDGGETAEQLTFPVAIK